MTTLTLLYAGRVECLVAGRRVDLIGEQEEPAWLGELTFLADAGCQQHQQHEDGATGGTVADAAVGSVATATCVVVSAAEAAAGEPAEALVWDQVELKALLTADRKIALALQVRAMKSRTLASHCDLARGR